MTVDGDGGRVALALSGGGSRAIAFQLGCLRALHDVGLLQHVSTISAVSGGSVLAALYCSHPGDFDAFECHVRAVLARGFVWPSLRMSVTSLEGVRALGVRSLITLDRGAALAARLTLGRLPFARRWGWLSRSPFVRSASRTTILRRVFSEMFEGRRLADLRSDRPRLVVVACELRAKAAFYFTGERLHCWRYGSASAEGIELADAVVASAAYPAFLPAIDAVMEFERDGVNTRRRVTLTDGGVYDNLGLAPLWPGRDPTISLDVGDHDRIVSCRAGYGLAVGDPAGTFISRMNASFESVFARAQNLATARLHELARTGGIAGFILPYLGQQDDRLGYPPSDLIRCEEVLDYPTDFAAMSPKWIDRLSRRGEQLVHALLREHWPWALRERGDPYSRS